MTNPDVTMEFMRGLWWAFLIIAAGGISYFIEESIKEKKGKKDKNNEGG